MDERFLEMFRTLNKSGLGKDLIDYIKSLRWEIFSPESLTPENLLARKEALEIMEKYLVQRIVSTGTVKQSSTNAQYE
jgi:hypothetical protein